MCSALWWATPPAMKSSRCTGGRVIGIDAALKDGAGGEVLLWDGKRLLRGLADGSRKVLQAGEDDGTADAMLPDAEDRAAAGAKAEQATKDAAARR